MTACKRLAFALLAVAANGSIALADAPCVPYPECKPFPLIVPRPKPLAEQAKFYSVIDSAPKPAINVPEPSSLFILGGALIGLAWVRRKRR